MFDPATEGFHRCNRLGAVREHWRQRTKFREFRAKAYNYQLKHPRKKGVADITIT